MNIKEILLYKMKLK